ncbi:hypothetical protein JR065_10120 [Xanthomonas sp. AmX2]|uniref:hypothetical protein n=1 Tax=Xanthomonas sp. TaxID=29446 RepID=UPI001982088B|nr:hypothetical protein [Xanthomonas sp.]MBN6150696.1 hypothetical protein [Xanthomonas sp.]
MRLHHLNCISTCPLGGRLMDGRWHLLAGDACFHPGEMDPFHPHCTPGLRFYPWMLEKDRAARLRNQRRLRELNLRQAGAVTVFCSHDVSEFERLSGHSAALPAEALLARAD